MSALDHPVFAGLRSGIGELVELLQELVRCHPLYGTAGQEAALDLTAQYLHGIGFDVRRRTVQPKTMQSSPHYVDVPAFGESFASYPSMERTSVRGLKVFSAPGPRIVLNGHLDVEFVTSPETWTEPGLWSSGRVVDGRVHGRGTCDMLGGVACYLYTLRKLVPYYDQAKGSVTVQLVLDEEIGGNGTLAELLDPPNEPTDVAIIAEPSDLVVCGHSRGFHQFKIVYTGAPVHMVFAHAFDNANRALPELIQLLEELNDWIAPRAAPATAGRYLMYGDVRGGTDAAVPADRVELLVTLALPPQISPADVLTRLEERLAHVCHDWPRRPQIQPYGLRFGASSLTSDPVRRALLSAGRRHNVALTEGEFPSACDARLFEAFGVPTVIYGPGSLRRAHGSSEYIEINELTEYCVVLADALLQLWAAA